MIDKLFPFQLDDAKWLATKKRAALFHEPGVGKTYISLGAAKLTGINSIGVYCPKSMIGAWKDEFYKWGITGYVTNYEQIITKKFIAHPVDLIIADEAQALKDWKAKRTRKFYLEIAKQCSRVWFLSGTPAPRSNADLYLLLSFIQPRQHGSFSEFTAQYCYFKSFKQGGRIIDAPYGYRNNEKINEILKQIGRRRTKEDVFNDLPDMTYSDVRLSPNTKLIAESLDIRESVVREAVLGGKGIPIHLSTLCRAIGVSKIAETTEFIRNLNQPTIVFALHTEVINSLLEGLSDLNVAKIDGSVSAEDRTKRVAQFQAGHLDVIILQTHAAGAGVTLTRATHVVHCERPWSAAAYEQANARAHRYGQKNAINVYNMVAPGTTDDMVGRILAEKTEGMREIVAP